ncbi:MAG: GTPase Era [Firmicutes bacterium]|nr:GTPase Era [Bacillota bacterium]HOB34133.1 GTPase Era [Bacillota bacterium]HPZ90631.1 GTPase Era [Bacillota bacterium]HQE02249.1 GTPase Era [Bacillota bacterium]
MAIVKSGFAAVTGLANAGKSTLINGLMQERLLITSEKKQTTRNQIRCILTGEDYQIILVDTPGIHQPKNKLGEYMLREVASAIKNSDVVLYIVDATNPDVDLFSNFTIAKPVILALNKVDLLSPADTEALVAQFSADPRFAAVVPVAALHGQNLDRLIAVIKDFLPAGDFLYPPDQVMDANFRFIAAELIREQALLHLDDEVPHGIAVEIDEFKEDEREARISATINVEKESHKGIVIGRGGSMLKKIGSSARLKIQEAMDKTVHLKLWVSVKKNWRKDPNQLKWLGYK